MSASAARPSDSRGERTKSGGSDHGGDDDGTSGNGLQRFVKEWIAPSALAAIVLGIFGWLIVDKFDTIKEQIQELQATTEKLDGRFETTNQNIASLSGDLKRIDSNLSGLIKNIEALQADVRLLLPVAATVNSIEGRTMRIESRLMQAPDDGKPK